jgi:hypothetical protein
LLGNVPSGEIFGTYLTRHVRDFLDCIESRGAPAANEGGARNGHIACHTAAIPGAVFEQFAGMISRIEQRFRNSAIAPDCDAEA